VLVCIDSDNSEDDQLMSFQAVTGRQRHCGSSSCNWRQRATAAAAAGSQQAAVAVG
jgi:hypothetical protein